MKIMDQVKKTINKIKYKHPWDKYYDKNERNIEIPNMSCYEYLRECNKNNMNSLAINYFNNKMNFKYVFGEIN